MLKNGKFLTATVCQFDFANKNLELTPHPVSEPAPLQYEENRSPAIFTKGEHETSALFFS
jgi:hypothetical protein